MSHDEEEQFIYEDLEDMAALKTKGEIYLNHIVKKLQVDGIQAQAEQLIGDPAEKIVEYAAEYHPNLIVIELADAMAGYGSPEMPKAWIYDQVRALTGRIKAQNIPCVWVGPIWGNEGPPYRKTVSRVTEMSQFLAQTVAPCTYVDSTQFARPGQWPTTDGQHLTEAGYRAWGQGITTTIARLRSQNALR